MKKLVLVCLTLIPCLISAQDWAPIYSNSASYFDSSKTTTPPPNSILGQKIDSVALVAGDSVLFPFLQRSNNVHPYLCVQLFATSWMGNKIVKQQDTTLFYNNYNETIQFVTPTAIGQSWIFHIDSNQHYIEAQLDYFDTVSINGQLDSVAILRLSTFDNNQAPIANTILTDSIVLSKTKGLLNTYRWSDFPYKNESAYQLIPYTNLTRGEVYNYDINDEFHYQTSYPTSPPDYSNVKITGKWYSSNQKIVFYEREVKNERSTVDYTTNPPHIVRTYQFYTDTVSYGDLQQVINMGVPTEPIIGPDTNNPPVKYFSVELNQYNNRETEDASENTGYYDIDSSCFMASQSYYSVKYIKGCGEVRSHSAGLGGYGNLLIYFKKGTETWGTPHLITGIENPKIVRSELEISPNPVQTVLSISKQSIPFKSIEIMDSRGRKITSQNFKEQIDVSHLQKGIYFIRFIGDETIQEGKFIKN